MKYQLNEQGRQRILGQIQNAWALEELNGWEMEFLKSIEKLLSGKTVETISLTTKQYHRLEQIFEKIDPIQT